MYPSGVDPARTSLPRTLLLRVARLVSGLTRLPLLAVPLFLLVGAAEAGGAGLLWALFCLLLTSGLSLAYLSYLTRSGKVGDPRRIGREERVKPLRFVAGLHAGAFVLVALLAAPISLRAVLLSYALSTAAFALVTPFLSLSLHAAGVAGALVCLLFVFGAWGLLFAPVLPLVWWARASLGRHTSTELAVGTLVGGGLTWAAFLSTVGLVS